MNPNKHIYPDAFEYNERHFPLLKYAVRYEAIQEPGELLFVPAESPHAVQNLEPIHGLSMNYVDVSNVGFHLWETMFQEEWRRFEQFTDNVTFQHGLRSSQDHAYFGEWKS